MDNPRYRYEYDPEKAYDFVTGEDGPVFRCTCGYPPEPDCPVHKDDPRFARPLTLTEISKPSLWQRFLDWWVNG